MFNKPRYPTLDHSTRHALDVSPYNADTLEIMYGCKPPSISHLHDNAGEVLRFKPSDRLMQLDKVAKYQQRPYEYKPALHWGQLKLFLSEVEFLTRVLRECPPDVDVWFIYAGAAPGHHIKFLASLFPKVHFELYDPNDFVMIESDMIKIHVQFFTDKDASYWAESGRYTVFCSDIRTEPATSENIIHNMQMQLGWWRIMNPELSMFKFRLPWSPGKTEYPDGDIYMQAYPGPTSTETRLVCKKNAPMKLYDNTDNEDACYYHNSITRSKKYQTVLGQLSLYTDGIDMCYDCASFIHIMHEYLTYSSKNANIAELKKLLRQVQHEISFGKNNILTKSVKYIGDAITHLVRMAYVPCNNKKCLVCISGEDKEYHSLKPSRATLANYSNSVMG